jgi:transposase-like protein
VEGKEVIPMVLKFECPRCGKGERSEVVEIIGERKYRMKCEDCQCTYILTANVEEEKKSDTLGGD